MGGDGNWQGDHAQIYRNIGASERNHSASNHPAIQRARPFGSVFGQGRLHCSDGVFCGVLGQVLTSELQQ